MIHLTPIRQADGRANIAEGWALAFESAGRSGNKRIYNWKCQRHRWQKLLRYRYKARSGGGYLVGTHPSPIINLHPTGLSVVWTPSNFPPLTAAQVAFHSPRSINDGPIFEYWVRQIKRSQINHPNIYLSISCDTL